MYSTEYKIQCKFEKSISRNILYMNHVHVYHVCLNVTQIEQYFNTIINVIKNTPYNI